jgi:hypothetical protein
VGDVVESELVVLAELSDRAVAVDDASCRALSGVDVVICAGVEVDETNGGAFSM